MHREFQINAAWISHLAVPSTGGLQWDSRPKSRIGESVCPKAVSRLKKRGGGHRTHGTGDSKVSTVISPVFCDLSHK